jgi:hypothetical protein
VKLTDFDFAGQSYVYDVLLERGLKRLHDLAVTVYACPYPTGAPWSHGGRYRFRTRSALEILERQAG